MRLSKKLIGKLIPPKRHMTKEQEHWSQREVNLWDEWYEKVRSQTSDSHNLAGLIWTPTGIASRATLPGLDDPYRILSILDGAAICPSSIGKAQGTPLQRQVV